MTKYTWDSSKKYCSTEAHATSPTCPDCDTATQCTGCQAPIAAGEVHAICRENGEAAHPGCKGRAAASWVDYY
ncbi:hypothetical protein [Micromonospora sp. WMMD980]|uniref:hypothetical protein n=1 Tax=Micromonospora sp. WMMD980 TaxID=3016088 RepID=UPI002417E188|nr:hypothetical protein [Micromonospora sp. WMMD980]MDG4798999.1 hypothetical protein [Micromonospora sp. WMMD980]MDG4799065.1 hypothetical protein [Micromonospora sp. WMMD980]